MIRRPPQRVRRHVPRLDVRGRLCRASLAAAAAWAALAGPVSGQLLNFRSYGHAAGLPQIQIMALLQDQRGFLWLGSYGGLARFDGRTFTTVTAEQGLSSNMVADLALDAAKELVVATSGGGVCFLLHGNVQCIGVRDGLPSDNVTSVLAEPNGTVWVGTEGGLSLVRRRRVIRTYTAADGLPSSSVKRVIHDANGGLWVSTSAGSARMVGDHFVADRAGVPGTEPVTVLGATSRGLVLTTIDAVYLERNGTTRRIAESPDARGGEARDVAEGPDGTLWIATYAGVLRDRNGEVTRLTEANGLLDNRVDRVIVDTEGDVWFGTESGLNELVPGPFAFYGTKSGLPNPFVSYLLQDRRGRIWAATEGGPAIWDGTRFHPVHLPAPAAGITVYPMVNIPGGGILLGTLGAGLAWVRPSGTRLYGLRDGLPSDTVWSLLADSDGVWVGTARGLAHWSAGRVTVPTEDSAVARAAIWSMAEDVRGRLWLGPHTGGVLIGNGRRFVRMGKAQGLTDQTVWDMVRAPDGAVWLATNGDGVFRVKGDSIARFSTVSGLVNDFVWQVQPDRNGGIWFFTNQGLDRLRDGKIRYYGQEDGLVDLEGSSHASLEDSSGDLWFGTPSGVYRYTPSLDVTSDQPPPVYIQAFRASGREFPLSGAVLPAKSSSIEVTFSSPTYRDPSAVRFRYRLGPDGSWSAPQAEPRVSLAGLGPGTYVLDVTAENAAGQRSREPASLEFSLRPRFWATWWFRALLLLLVMSAIGSIPWLQARKLEREHKVLNDLVQERTRDLAEKTVGLEHEIAGREAAEEERRKLELQLHQAQKMEAIGRLAGGIAHDFNNLLTAVMGHAQLLEQDVEDGRASPEDVREIQEAARRGASLVSQLLAYSRQQIIQQELVDLNETVEASARLLQRVIGDDIILNVGMADGPARVRFDRTQLDQVLVNLAVNARDAMPSGGTLCFAVGHADVDEPLRDLGPDEVEAGSYVTLEVHDTGTGMDGKVLERAFDPFFTTKEMGRGTGLGLATVYGAVHQSGGSVQVNTVVGKGTTFILYFPCVEG